MDSLLRLPAPCCVLLAIQLAAEANIPALRELLNRRRDALELETALRILLTYLPESTDPSVYLGLVQECVSGAFEPGADAVGVDTSVVQQLSAKEAQKRVQKAHLLPLIHPSYTDAPPEPLTNFLIHRAHRIDAETGLLDFTPQLVNPFLDGSTYLQTWYISTVLPILRHDYEYYPSGASITLDSFVKLNDHRAIEVLLSHSKAQREDNRTEQAGPLGRDIRSLVGPWVYGCGGRKRRRLNENRRSSITSQDGGSQLSDVEHDWDYLFAWLLHKAPEDFSMVVQGMRDWDGPEDVDYGGYLNSEHVAKELQQKLELRYAQAAISSIYAVESDAAETIRDAHSLLARLASLLDFESPPDLAANVETLRATDLNISVLQNTTATVLQPGLLLRADHPLTTPTPQTFSLLQKFVHSAYLLAAVKHSISIVDTVKLRLRNEEEEQLLLLQKILHTCNTQLKKEDEQWKLLRSRLVWLWDWGMSKGGETQHGVGVLGKIDRRRMEKEILKAFLNAGRTSLATKLYVQASQPRCLSPKDVEDCIMEVAMHFYDTASNGNRTRGNMKKASDLISAFRPFFKQSSYFQQTEALLAATHSLSFYSLTLQRGVPFQPVSIRVRSDPLNLIQAVLEQNPRSYTKLDDLSTIGENLVSAGLEHSEGRAPLVELDEHILGRQREDARRRVVGMAIEAALNEDDFESAYSYVTTRLKPSASPNSLNTPGPTGEDDTVSWKSAFIAGRYQGGQMSSSYTSAGSNANSEVRRIEQRMELLSQALLLAPSSALPEVLAVWQECEGELAATQAQESEADTRFNDRADRRLPGEFVTNVVQPRREVGRGAVEEAPMGLFDVARGAAAAFSRNAFPLAGARTSVDGGGFHAEHQRTPSVAKSEVDSIASQGSDEGQRVRKRDMVASAVTGGLASGLGWVLGATPVNQQRADQR